MADRRKFLLDANIFIEAHKRYYGFDLCPGFWTSMIQQHQANRIFSIDRVNQEIVKNKDKLDQWTRQKAPSSLFKTTDDNAIIELFREMVEWVESESQYRREAKDEFARVADGWLVACAKAEGLIIVTHEVYNPEIQKKIPIPNVCRQFGVEYVNTFDMLRELGVKFILKKRKVI